MQFKNGSFRGIFLVLQRTLVIVLLRRVLDPFRSHSLPLATVIACFDPGYSVRSFGTNSPAVQTNQSKAAGRTSPFASKLMRPNTVSNSWPCKDALTASGSSEPALSAAAAQ